MKYRICDIHAHVVPSIDDGPSSLNMSMKIIRKAYKQGTRDIVCSSHSWGNSELYLQNLELLKEEIKKNNIDINLHSGCEIYCNGYNVLNIIYNLNQGIIQTINGTKYVLVEFEPDASAVKIITCVEQICGYGYGVVIAHIERYSNLFVNSNAIQSLKEIGCLFQINAYSIQDERDIKIKEFARKLLKEKQVTFIGSDVHRTDHRSYMIENGVDYIWTHCDEEYAKDICYRNAERILDVK